MRKHFFILAIFLSQFAFGQQREIDSLKNLLKTDKKDTTKLIHLYGISDLSETIGNYPDGIKYGNHTITFANSLIKSNKNKTIQRTAKRHKAKAYNNLGIIYYLQGNYPDALKYFLACLRIRESLDIKIGIAASYNNIGNVYKDQGNYQEAKKNYIACLKINEALGDKIGIATSYHNLGNLYENQGNFQEALKNYFVSLKIKESINYKNGYSVSYNNIGIVYENLGNYQEALKNHFAALKLRTEMKDKFGIANSYINIGNINLKLKNQKTGKKYLEDALILSKEIGAKLLIKDTYCALAEADGAMGNFKSQVTNYKLYILYRDSLNNEETRKKTIQSQMTYDFEKKEAVAKAEHKSELKNQAKIAEEKNRKQKLVTYFVIGGLFLVLIFAVFVFRSLRITKKQKVLIEMQKIAVEQHQKEIIDSIHYAKRIQTALLPTDKNIEKNINRLKKA